ncbi:fimbrillin family protein [Hoylesella enoeca]|uniref:fimbrillin family protein n=1 Tax=Hoylesella enoeca TaxID=76123 RepID=UPI0028894714|nr:fimbrillin family protein [Hoylesella enoeca]
MSVSCADEDIAKDQKYDGKNGVSFSVSDVQDAPDAEMPTRATDAETYLTHSIDFNEAGTSDMCLQESTIPGVNPMKRTPQTRAWLKASIDANFGAFACQNGSAGPDYFDNEQVTPSGQMLQPKRWDASASSLKFYAVYPYMDGTNAQQKLVYPTTGSLPYVAFEASTDIANQTDLMTAETATLNYTSTGGAPHVVPLKFYHALTAIRFGIGSNLSWNKTIKSIEFQGIKNAGHFDLATKTWSHQSGTQNFKLDNLSQSTSGTLNTVIVKDGNTFLMVPQTLPSGAKIVITFADNSQITANIGGKTWAAGTTKTYMMTEKNSNWEYKIETTDPAVIAYDQTTSTTPYTIKSYRKDPATNTFQAVKWKVVSYQESTDGGLTWGAETQTKPAWLTNLTTENGDGGTAAESGSVTLTIDIIDKLAPRNKALKEATALGSAGTPYDLSTKGGSVSRSTANSYLISAPGHYRIPLVYGNAIENGATNANAYISHAATGNSNVLYNFQDHAGHAIDDPWIEKTNGGANSGVNGAEVVWADAANLVHSPSITHVGGNAFLDFEVTAADIQSGNAVVAVTKGSAGSKTVLWSWHLWFAPKDALDKIPVTNHQGVVYNFTKEALGWKPTQWSSSTYDKPRTVKVKVEQTVANNGTKQAAVINITQEPGSVKQGATTLYQFGRKDAFPGVDASKLAANSHFTENAGDNMSIKNGIQHPDLYYTLGSNWSNNYGYYNLWSADNTVTGGWNVGNDNPVVKTVYDPSPVGFKMPANNAFTGFTADGQNNGTMNVDGTDNWQTYQNNFGHNFWTNSSKTATINFPASGYRGNLDGSLYDVGNSGFYWSAVPRDADGGCGLIFGSGNVGPLSYGYRSFGVAARPVSE